MQQQSSSTASVRSSALSSTMLRQNILLADGSNWIAFKLRVRGLLSAVWHAVDTKAAAAASAQSAVEDKKAASATAADATDDSVYACATLAQLLPDEMLMMVQQEMESQNAAAVWSKLTAHFERKTTASRAHTRAQLHHIQNLMKSGEKFDLYKARVMALSMQLQGMGEIVTESELVFVLLQGLPSSFKGVREALEMQDALTVDGVSDKLRDVMERRAFGEAAEEEERVLFAGSGRGGGRGRGGYNRGGRGGNSNSSGRTAAGNYNGGEQTQRKDDEPMDEEQHRCALCRARGHWERFCPHRRGQGNTCYRCGDSAHQMRDCQTDLSKVKKNEIGSTTAAYRLFDDQEYDDQDVGF